MYIDGAAKMDTKTIVCEVTMESGKVYKLRSFLKNASILEFNDNITKNFDLLLDKVRIIFV
jgi:hypothetical protein